MIKFCKRCNAETDRAKSGQCKPCGYANAKVWRDANADTLRAAKKVYATENKEKLKANRKVFKAENVDKVRAARKAYRAANQDKILAYRAATADKKKLADQAYRESNREKVRARHRTWTAANIDKERVRCRAKQATRRVLTISAGGKHTAKDIKALFTLQKGRCICCRESLKSGYHVDHIYPIINGGANGKNDIQLLCPTCNLSKGAKHPIDFMQSRGFLL